MNDETSNHTIAIMVSVECVDACINAFLCENFNYVPSIGPTLHPSAAFRMCDWRRYSVRGMPQRRVVHPQQRVAYKDRQ